jgi:hypothetical protein
VDIIGQVLSVSGRPLNNGSTIYDIAFSDGVKYTTFDGEVAQKTNALVGQQVSASVTSKQKGQYMNHYWNDVAPQGQLTSDAAPLPPVVLPIADPVPIIPMQQYSGGMAPEREAKIVKQSVFSTAFNFVGQLFQGAGPEAKDEAVEMALEIARTLYNRVQGGVEPAPEPVLLVEQIEAETSAPVTDPVAW